MEISNLLICLCTAPYEEICLATETQNSQKGHRKYCLFSVKTSVNSVSLWLFYVT